MTPIATFFSVIASPTSARSSRFELFISNVITSASTWFSSSSAGLYDCTDPNMRCCDGLPQHVWHHTSVFARSPFTVLLNTSSMNSGLITLSTKPRAASR